MMEQSLTFGDGDVKLEVTFPNLHAAQDAVKQMAHSVDLVLVSPDLMANLEEALETLSDRTDSLWRDVDDASRAVEKAVDYANDAQIAVRDVEDMTERLMEDRRDIQTIFDSL